MLALPRIRELFRVKLDCRVFRTLRRDHMSSTETRRVFPLFCVFFLRLIRRPPFPSMKLQNGFKGLGNVTRASISTVVSTKLLKLTFG